MLLYSDVNAVCCCLSLICFWSLWLCRRQRQPLLTIAIVNNGWRWRRHSHRDQKQIKERQQQTAFTSEYKSMMSINNALCLASEQQHQKEEREAQSRHRSSA